MAYFMPKWTNPGRKRNCKAKYNSPDYVKYYDIDLDDLTMLVNKLHNNKPLTAAENDRYAVYVYTMIYIVFENPKFKNKPYIEKVGLFEQAVFELLQALPKFEHDRGSSIYSFAYRCCYIAFIHYYNDMTDMFKKNKAIEQHWIEELDEYLEEFSSHKVSNLNKEG